MSLSTSVNTTTVNRVELTVNYILTKQASEENDNKTFKSICGLHVVP